MPAPSEGASKEEKAVVVNMQNTIAALRGGLLQQDRLLKLDTPLGANVLTVQRVVGRSRIGRSYEFTLDVLSTDSDLELKKLIAQPVTLWIQQGDRSYRPINGYVHTARRLGDDGGLTTYQLAFADFTHFLKFRRDQRLWNDATVDQIISDVLNKHPHKTTPHINVITPDGDRLDIFGEQKSVPIEEEMK